MMDLGILLIPPYGVTYTYVVTDNTKDGVLEVEVTATRGLATKAAKINITGFEKILDSALKAFPDTTPTSKRTTLASSFQNGTTSQSILGISVVEQQGVIYTYEVTGNKFGQVTVEVTVANSGISKVKTFKVTGFKKTHDIPVYVYDSKEYLSRKEAEAAARASEEGKIVTDWNYLYNNKWYSTQMDAEADQAAAIPNPPVPQTWVSKTQPVDGIDVATTTTVAYKFGRVYESESEALSSFTRSQLFQRLKKSGNEEYKIDGKNYETLFSTTGELGTIRDRIEAIGAPIFQFSKDGQEYVEVNYGLPSINRILTKSPKNTYTEKNGDALSQTTSTNVLLDLYNKIESGEYFNLRYASFKDTFMFIHFDNHSEWMPYTPAKGVQSILKTLKHLKRTNNLSVYEDEFKNYFNNKPSAYSDQPYYDMFEWIMPRSCYDRAYKDSNAGNIYPFSAMRYARESDEFKNFHMSTKNLDAIIKYLETHRNKIIPGPPTQYVATNLWKDQIFSSTVTNTPENALGLIALGDKYKTFQPPKDITIDDRNIDEVEQCSKTQYNYNFGYNWAGWDNPAQPPDSSKDYKIFYPPPFFDSTKTVVYKKSDFLASHYDTAKKDFFIGNTPTPTEPDAILDEFFGDIPDQKYYIDPNEDGVNSYTTKPPTSTPKKVLIPSKYVSDLHVAGTMGLELTEIWKEFKGFVMDGKFYSSQQVALASSTHSSEIQLKQKITYDGKDYQKRSDAITAADTAASALITTRQKNVPIASPGTSTSPNYLPVRFSKNRIKSIEDMYN